MKEATATLTVKDFGGTSGWVVVDDPDGVWPEMFRQCKLAGTEEAERPFLNERAFRRAFEEVYPSSTPNLIEARGELRADAQAAIFGAAPNYAISLRIVELYFRYLRRSIEDRLRKGSGDDLNRVAALLKL